MTKNAHTPRIKIVLQEFASSRIAAAFVLGQLGLFWSLDLYNLDPSLGIKSLTIFAAVLVNILEPGFVSGWQETHLFLHVERRAWILNRFAKMTLSTILVLLYGAVVMSLCHSPLSELPIQSIFLVAAFHFVLYTLFVLTEIALSKRAANRALLAIFFGVILLQCVQQYQKNLLGNSTPNLLILCTILAFVQTLGICAFALKAKH